MNTYRFTSLLMLLLLFAGCTEQDMINRDQRQLQGTWKLRRAFQNKDNRTAWKNANHLEGARISFSSGNRVEYTPAGSPSMKGTFRLTANQLHLEFTDTSGQPDTVILWHDITITGRQLNAYSMAADREIDMHWRRD